MNVNVNDHRSVVCFHQWLVVPVLWPAAKPPKNFRHAGSVGADQRHPMTLRMRTSTTHFLVDVVVARLDSAGAVAYNTTIDFPCVAVAIVPVPLPIAVAVVQALLDVAFAFAFPKWPVEPFVAHGPTWKPQ